MCFIFPLACLECGSRFGIKHELMSSYFTEKSIPGFTNSNCFIIRTMQGLLFLYILGRSNCSSLLQNYLCVSFLASESFPLTVDPPAVNNGALVHTHTHTLVFKAQYSVRFLQKDVTTDDRRSIFQFTDFSD